MTGSTIQQKPLKYGLLLVTALCLALAVLSAPPVMAAENGACDERAWIDMPGPEFLTQLASDYDDDLPVAVAISENYAVMVYVFGALNKQINIYFGSVSDGSVWFGQPYSMTIGENTTRPSVAINDHGHAVFAFESDNRFVYLACKVRGSGHGIGWGCQEPTYTEIYGRTPSIAITNDDRVVTVHEGLYTEYLYYQIGRFDPERSAIHWSSEKGHHYDHGSYPYVAVDLKDGVSLVEAHHGSTNIFKPHALYMKTGRLASKADEISWSGSHEYEGSGQTPTVAISNGAVVELHQSTRDYQTYYRYGHWNHDKVKWQGGTGAHLWSKGNAEGPSLAASSDGKLLMGFASFTDHGDSFTHEFYANVGRFGYGPVCTLPTVTTDPVSHVSATGAVSGGQVTSPGLSPVTARGVCWSTSQIPTINDSHTSDGKGAGSFTSHLSGLPPNTAYYLRAYATNADGTGYGGPVFFMTGQGTPTATTFAPWFVTSDGAEISGAVLKEGSAPVTDRGLCWSTSANPTTADGHMSAGSGLGGFQEFVSGLEAGTTYYLRAYGSNEYGTSYGANVSFVTADPSLATVYTADPQDITASSATLGGEVTGQGSGPVTERGVVWDTAPRPNLNNQRAPMGSGSGAFSGNLTGFASENTYYLRAYAINDTGTSFGQEKIFTASSDALPRVITTAPYGETASSALSGGYVTNSGQTAVTARGVCWSTAPNPDLSGPHSEDGDGAGAFHSAITDLSQDAGYYVRAYATNSAGTSYGAQYFFHSAHPAAPTVRTLGYSGLGNDSVTMSGEVVMEGGGPVTARGVCWSTSPHPKVTDNVVNAGSGVGEFSATISGLQAEKVYYARAFATNEYGAAYGHIVRFRTSFCEYPCR
ncbi:hypothetical protein AAU61_06635 [Desulfocarbo indianensis]|nr:hypothetical protein AAU61_06635 [Desulfocarbo indianensis]